MRTIDFSLKTQWFDAIASGKKKTEYRDLNNSYYASKFINTDSYIGKTDAEVVSGLINGTLKPRWREFTHARFHCMGRTLLVEVKGVEIDKKNRSYAIQLGKIVRGKAIGNVAE